MELNYLSFNNAVISKRRYPPLKHLLTGAVGHQRKKFIISMSRKEADLFARMITDFRGSTNGDILKSFPGKLLNYQRKTVLKMAFNIHLNPL